MKVFHCPQSFQPSKLLGPWGLGTFVVVLVVTGGVLLGKSRTEQGQEVARQSLTSQEEIIGSTLAPTFNPIISPSSYPSGMPSTQPTSTPSHSPSRVPSFSPSLAPSESFAPSVTPSSSPSFGPSTSPSETTYPSVVPSFVPSKHPSSAPSTSTNPSLTPSTFPSSFPSTFPSGHPTSLPSAEPTNEPSTGPSFTPSSSPTLAPTKKPTRKPTTKPTNRPSRMPTNRPSNQPTARPTNRPTRKPSEEPTVEPTEELTEKPTVSCFRTLEYDSIDADIERIKDSISNDVARSHFLGGIVRLVAHDFMDYDRTADQRNRMGPDGCIDMDNDANAGLDTIWCRDCELTLLYNEKYSHISRADFWIASANAVIRQTSVRNALDLKKTFRWGRNDVDSCNGSAERLPTPGGCSDVEDVFLRRMGLEWKDAVALLGAHTLGRGHEEFSGHEGTWVDSDEEAQVFDKKYYEEIFRHAWTPRNTGSPSQDWSRSSSTRRRPKMMLNTDMCLVFNLERRFPCCSNTDRENRCSDDELSDRECRRYPENHPRMSATEAVQEMLGGNNPNSNNDPFYNAFAVAWEKATTNGARNLVPLVENCEPL